MSSVLIADDDLFIRKLLREELTRENYQVETVESGSSAIRRILRRSFDVLILDIHMTGISGLETISMVKKICPRLPIIVVTGNRSAEMERKVRAETIFYYFVKPFDMKEMKEVVKAVIKKR